MDWQYLILRHSTFVSKLLQISSWLHSLKLTVRPWKSAGPRKETIVFQPPIFRGELLVSGKKQYSSSVSLSVRQGIPVSGWVPAHPDVHCTARSMRSICSIHPKHMESAAWQWEFEKVQPLKLDQGDLLNFSTERCLFVFEKHCYTRSVFNGVEFT